MTEPSIEALTDTARRTRDALAKATDAPPAPPPADETPAARLTREWGEQAEAERADAELERRVAFEHPTAPTQEALDDPLRAAFAASRQRRRGRTRRGLR